MKDNLPPLPPYASEFRPRWLNDPGGYNEDQMKAYARAAIEHQSAAPQPQPVQQCKWPTCQSEKYQQDLEDQIMRELVGEQPVQEPVAYLDIGAGGYLDIATNLTDEQLLALPKGRHALVIAGTFGIDGYTSPQAQPLSDADVQQISRALHQHGLTLVRTVQGFGVMKLGEITAYAATKGTT